MHGVFMSLSTKIDLENLIFARAAHLQVPVHAKYGGLFSPAQDLHLQTFIYVYNANFCEENWKRFCAPPENLQPRQEYLAQGRFLPGATRVYQARELNFELMLSEEK